MTFLQDILSVAWRLAGRGSGRLNRSDLGAEAVGTPRAAAGGWVVSPSWEKRSCAGLGAGGWDRLAGTVARQGGSRVLRGGVERLALVFGRRERELARRGQGWALSAVANNVGSSATQSRNECASFPRATEFRVPQRSNESSSVVTAVTVYTRLADGNMYETITGDMQTIQPCLRHCRLL